MNYRGKTLVHPNGLCDADANTFHVTLPFESTRALCGVKCGFGGASSVLGELALKEDQQWPDVCGAICVHCVRMLKPGKQLWACAANRLVISTDGGRKHRAWVPDGITYVHADNELGAIEEWGRTTERNTKLVACGRVIGYHVEDTKGLILSV